MSDYPAGTVAVATVRGVKGVRVTLDPNGHWFTAEPVAEWRWHDPDEVTDVRLLVVLDLGQIPGADWVAALRCMLPSDVEAWDEPEVLTADIADQIEAQAKPPRIPEPGLWGVAEADALSMGAARYNWVRDDKYPDVRWVALECAGLRRAWKDLIDPVLIREGVSE